MDEMSDSELSMSLSAVYCSRLSPQNLPISETEKERRKAERKARKADEQAEADRQQQAAAKSTSKSLSKIISLNLESYLT
jgi:hypothetical protein